MNELLDEMPKDAGNYSNSLKSAMKDIETDRITKDGIILSYLAAQKKGIDYDLRKENYNRYATLSLDDLYNYHHTSLSKQPYTYCITASEKRINVDDLKKYGEVKKLSLQELFGY
jgi:hypothetical protein